MYFKTAVVFAIAFLFAGQAMGATLIAADAYAACNCPSNCSRKVGSSCKYYADPSHDLVYRGTCRKKNGSLACIRH
ncbi:hypothetical protein F4814DRAFT_402094 [Daldinia grandis]|nr:hypothetical protein F4814DRAFT_402094 [Daldinia grandis]